MTAKHTPTPWKSGLYSSIVGLPIMAQPDPAQNTCVLAGVRGDRKTAEANAAFIVRAVNAHAALVKALETILTPNPHTYGPARAKHIEDARTQAEIALRLAKGEA